MPPHEHQQAGTGIWCILHPYLHPYCYYMLELCTIGHITLDKIQTTRSVKYMPGGTAWYFSKALRNLKIDYLLVTAVASTEMNIIEDLEKENISIISLPSEHTVYFENIYPENQDHREQNVHNTA